MTDKFKPGDLLVSDQHPNNVYLVISLRDCHITDHEIGLVRMSFVKDWTITLCNLAENASWTSSQGLFKAGFSKVGRIDLSTLNKE